MNVKFIVATTSVLVVLLVLIGVFMNRNSAASPTDGVTLKEVVPQTVRAEPKPRTVEQPVKILGATESDIRFALAESERVTAMFQPKMPVLSAKDQKQLDDAVKQIMDTKVALSKSENFDIPLQEAGRLLKISSAKFPQSGFIVVSRNSGESNLATSKLLAVGTHRDITIPLPEYVDGEELLIRVYVDSGDGVLETSKDKFADWGFAHANYKSLRNLRAVYYAPNIMEGSASMIVSGEQLSGDKMNPPQQTNLTRSYATSGEKPKKHFLVLHKDASGLPGRVLAVSHPFADYLSPWDGKGPLLLTEKVYDEMLFYIAYEDNGDGRFSLEEDKPVRGQKDAIILVRFLVAPDFE